MLAPTFNFTCRAEHTITDDPENQPKCCPRLAYNHSYILTRQSQSTHPHPIQHPKYHEASMAVPGRRANDFSLASWWRREIDLKS